MMAEAGAGEGVNFIVECEELSDSSAPLRQGDVLEWLNEGADPWKCYAIIVTADCDIAHQKHGGLLACVPVLPHDDYLALFPLPARLSTAQGKLLERATSLIRQYQAANRPEFPVALSDGAVVAWIEASSADEIIDELMVADGKPADQLGDMLSAIRQCSTATSSGGFDVQLDALARAILVAQGETNFEKRREALARELLDRLQRLPGDAIFLHALSTSNRS
ncbi:MAG: hypothetical protein ACRDOS_07240 [Gaiellaceae bacterium]